MKLINNLGAQGDVMFRRIAALPTEAREEAPDAGRYVVAHSETGHHHYLEAVPGVRRYVGDDALVSYLMLEDFAEVIHARPHDTHEPIKLNPGIYEVRRQREHTPEGFRRVED